MPLCLPCLGSECKIMFRLTKGLCAPRHRRIGDFHAVDGPGFKLQYPGGAQHGSKWCSFLGRDAVAA